MNKLKWLWSKYIMRELGVCYLWRFYVQWWFHECFLFSNSCRKPLHLPLFIETSCVIKINSEKCCWKRFSMWKMLHLVAWRESMFIYSSRTYSLLPRNFFMYYPTWVKNKHVFASCHELSKCYEIFHPFDKTYWSHLDVIWFYHKDHLFEITLWWIFYFFPWWVEIHEDLFTNLVHFWLHGLCAIIPWCVWCFAF